MWLDLMDVNLICSGSPTVGDTPDRISRFRWGGNFRLGGTNGRNLWLLSLVNVVDVFVTSLTNGH
jgi:hypothetical protein